MGRKAINLGILGNKYIQYLVSAYTENIYNNEIKLNFLLTNLCNILSLRSAYTEIEDRTMQNIISFNK